jgi:hypothetical protein
MGDWGALEEVQMRDITSNASEGRRYEHAAGSG